MAGADEGSPLAELVYLTLSRTAVTTVSAPFSVARRLLQVQFVPLATRRASFEQRAEVAKEESERTLTASSGYVVEGPRTLLPVLDGYWHAMTLSNMQEGFLSLFKGNVTGIAVDVTRFVLRPTIESLLNESYGLDDDTPLQYLDSYWPNIGTLVASHVVTDALMAPAELVHTRLCVQPREEARKKYSGYFHCMRSVVAEEGVRGLYGGAPMLATLNVFKGLFRIGTHILLERYFGVAEGSLTFNMARSLFQLVELAVTLPLETVVTRLQAQHRLRYMQSGKRYQTMVATSPLPYAGPLDCARRIVDEEGIGSLYRGIGLHMAAVLVEFVSSAIASDEMDDIEAENLSDD